MKKFEKPAVDVLKLQCMDILNVSESGANAFDDKAEDIFGDNWSEP